jgi:hypothetical protein
LLRSSIDLDTYRSYHVGFIVQAFYLLPTLRAIENVQVPMLAMKREHRTGRNGPKSCCARWGSNTECVSIPQSTGLVRWLLYQMAYPKPFRRPFHATLGDGRPINLRQLKLTCRKSPHTITAEQALTTRLFLAASPAHHREPTSRNRQSLKNSGGFPSIACPRNCKPQPKIKRLIPLQSSERQKIPAAIIGRDARIGGIPKVWVNRSSGC